MKERIIAISILVINLFIPLETISCTPAYEHWSQTFDRSDYIFAGTSIGYEKIVHGSFSDTYTVYPYTDYYVKANTADGSPDYWNVWYKHKVVVKETYKGKAQDTVFVCTRDPWYPCAVPLEKDITKIIYSIKRLVKDSTGKFLDTYYFPLLRTTSYNSGERDLLLTIPAVRELIEGERG